MPSKVDSLTTRVILLLETTLKKYIADIPGIIIDSELSCLLAGKMLRTKIAEALAGDNWADSLPCLPEVCAATELIHTASLFHDDVVDGASIRRGKPVLWRMFTPSSAILIGDMLFCDALALLISTGNTQLYSNFNSKVREVCRAEVRQELFLRGEQSDTSTCIDIARQKTGPLFAFTASACAGDNHELAAALEEAGYRFGLSYQLSDDMIDETGDEITIGKTLGTDRLRQKYTLAHIDPVYVHSIFIQLCKSITEPLTNWPLYKERLECFAEETFRLHA